MEATPLGTLKRISPSGGRYEIFLGVFRVKNHDFMPKNHIFSNFRGGRRARWAPPPPAFITDFLNIFHSYGQINRLPQPCSNGGTVVSPLSGQISDTLR